MIIGYARVSTQEQELARQTDALRHYGVEELYTEKMTGTKQNRPELRKVKNLAKAGDTVVIESLSRLGRSSKDLLTLIDYWNKAGVKLVSLKESIDTTTPTGKLILTVLSAICQFERDITVQRTNEGLKAAKARGRKGGRPRISGSAIKEAVSLYHTRTQTISEICRATQISHTTLYTALRKSK
jgi:DNA invertase Pin-like site-specific DNA recombinase